MSELEEWRDVVGYEGIYQISDLGRVKRIALGVGTKPARILRPRPHSGGYLLIMLSSNKQPKSFLIHRLVACAFLGAPPDGYEVNHINGVKTDNRVSNLEWVTSSENKLHSTRVLGNHLGELNAASKLTANQVRKIREMRAYTLPNGQPRYTLRELSSIFNVSEGNISMIVNYKTWKHIP